MEDPELAIQGGVIEQQGLSRFCKLCQESFPAANIQIHISKDSHKNTLYWEAVNNPATSQYLLSSLPQVVRSAKESDDIQALDRSRYSYVCKVCSGKKPFFGLRPLQDHLNGKDHKKAQTLLQMTSAMKIDTTSSTSTPQTMSSTTQLNAPSRNSSVQKALVSDSTTAALPPDVQKLLQNKIIQIIENNGIMGFKCIICNNQSTGVEPLRQHIQGKPHNKKVAQNAYMVSDSRELPQPSADMEWNTSDSSQDQTLNQNQPSPDIQNIIYPSSPVLSDSSTYKNLSLPRGLVYIFNNTFSGRLDERRGSKQDSIRLTVLFNSMGYKVKLCPDMSKNAVFQKLTEIQNEPELKNVDCLIIIIMSHGDTKDERRFLASDMEAIELDEVRYRFTTTNCPALSGKPKIFLSNFCRGDITESPMPVALESDAPANYTNREAPRDMCTIHASISGFEARRHPEKGTVFAQSLCSVLSQHSHNTEMADLYRELCRDMIERVATTPEQQNYFFLKFYFNPTQALATSTA